MLEASYGLADQETGRENTTRTAFSIGSITKFLTATALHTLAAQERVDIDAPVSRYLSGLPDDKRTITIRQLLEHRSGLADDYWDQHRELESQDAYIDMMLRRPMDGEPGEAFAYNNFGYVLLQRVIETVTGQNYEQALTTLVFEPADARRIGYERAGDWDGDVAFYQDLTVAAWSEALGVSIADPRHRPDYLGPDGSGGILATPSALSRVFRSVADSDGERSLMSYRPALPSSSYSSGLWFASTAMGDEIWHGGYDDTTGVLSLMSHWPDEDVTIIILSNTHLNRLLNSTVLRRVTGAAVAGSELPMPPIPAETPVSSAELAGRYVTASGASVDITTAGDQLAVWSDTQAGVAAVLLPGLFSDAQTPVPDGISAMIAALDAGDCSAFLALTMETARFQAYCDRALGAWAQINGAFGAHESLSLLHRTRTVHEGQPETWWMVASRHENGGLPLRFVEDEAGGLFVSPLDLPPSISQQLIAVGEDCYVAWNPYLGAGVNYCFDRASAAVMIGFADGASIRLDKL